MLRRWNIFSYQPDIWLGNKMFVFLKEELTENLSPLIQSISNNLLPKFVYDYCYFWSDFLNASLDVSQ